MVLDRITEQENMMTNKLLLCCWFFHNIT